MNCLSLLSLSSISKYKCSNIKIDGVIGDISKELSNRYLNGKFYEGTMFNEILTEGNVVNVDEISNQDAQLDNWN